jgi:uncharacterized protein YqiB (DUF1249 family)
MSLCEENFALFSRLAPQVREQRGSLVSRRKGGVDLYLIVEEQSPYTTLVRLTHYFSSKGSGPGPGPGSGLTSNRVADRPGPGQGADPDLRLRIYHDARQVEVESLRQSALPMRPDYQHPALAAKWKVNLFLAKWLRYCLHEGHRFVPGRSEVPLPEGDDLLSASMGTERL